jgi:hypothetical protein
MRLWEIRTREWFCYPEPRPTRAEPVPRNSAEPRLEPASGCIRRQCEHSRSCNQCTGKYCGYYNNPYNSTTIAKC